MYNDNMSMFNEYIEGSKKIIIITSQPLDPDCISSGILLKKYLEYLKYDVTFRFPRELTKEEIEQYDYIPFYEEFTKNAKDTRDILTESNFDTLILLDGVNWIQFYDSKNTTLPTPLLDKSKKIIQIDHHPGDPENLTQLQIKNVKASSVTEILINDVLPENFLTTELSTLAYIGIMGDTGNFNWNFTSNTMEVAAKLLNKGVNPTEAIDKMFFTKKREYMEMLKYCLENIEYDDELKTIFLLLSFDKLKIDNIDANLYKILIKAFIEHIAKHIKGYERGLVISEPEEKGLIRVNARGNNSTNKINLPELFKIVGGNGGGHFNASGMQTKSEFKQFVLTLKQEIKSKLHRTP